MTHDLIVIGSGILGLATAFLAHKQGQSVHVIEAEAAPVHSSIMNFGHACFTGQADLIQPVADRARRGWLQAAQDTGLWAAQSGTWIPAVTELEMQVLREFAAHRGEADVTLVGPGEIRDALANPDLEAVGGAHLPRDMRVNPREAAPRLVAWLASQGVTFTWNTRVTAVSDGRVDTVRGEYSARRVIACPGDQLRGLFPRIAEGNGVRVCTLAMALLTRPGRIPVETALLTGTSLARYDGFAAMPSVPQLRDELASREPELVAMVANLMATGIPNGLLVGDSHAYSLSPEPFIDEALAEVLIERASYYFGLGEPVVRQRWLGHYADSAERNLVLVHPDDSTTVAVVTSGIGMTLSFGIAELALSGQVVEGF
ncbi:TIGR03364 family FAD-dependent oxidoreductase [Corynebacterium liangguodongii]|uniref:TIGR03364 family FAD-dependent oxidoreductase n=1 Tax=Corynebacterium liangguodongii TaxID=2079535 RepID=A0A2S0WFC8_9CORY|nr:TIGR03364 family FAD-dependent oxidoreductase [Corynebacterium liangguodongii]AWB84487.1 TIGR03364 family FAD-dependent oxidoreductase [Corynebacterium liangguodongii]PWB98705.1 TIGR03364 family FAD-dependent oxidoreductase [Corynebacterium liangguodongii]